MRGALRCLHRIVREIRGRLIRWGSVSTAQAELVVRLAREEVEKALVPAEVHVAAPVVDGRVTVEGLVVSVKLHEGDYGDSLKITVKVSSGDGVWLCW